MDRLTHTALGAMKAAMHRQAVTANNLANVSTTGFRAELSSATPLYLSRAKAFVGEEVIAADMRAGPVTRTGRPLDIAIDGQALLAVQAEDGAEGYTRRGDLMLTETGLLTTGDGRPVIGDGGPLTLGAVDSVRIEPDGGVWIVPAGGNPAQPQQADRIKLVAPGLSTLVKHVDGLFRSREGIAATDPAARVTPGALEGSNVDTTATLVAMIDAARAWETQTKLLSQARDNDGETARLMQLPQ